PPEVTAIERGLDRARVAQHYFRASLRDPRKAVRRLSQLVGRRMWRLQQQAASGVAGAAAPIVSDLNAQGWAVGYSVAGEVVATGDGVDDLAAGDLVSAAGAGQAAH